MGFFSSISKTWSSVAKQVLSGNIPGATSTLLNAQVKVIPTASIFKQIATQATIPIVSGLSPGIIAGGISGKITPTSLSSFASTNPVAGLGVKPMALNVGGLLGSIGGILGQTNQSGNAYVNALSTGLNLAGSIIPVASRPPQVMSAPSVSVSNSTAMVAVAAGTRGLTQEIFNAGAKVLNRLGVPFKGTTASFSTALKRSLSTIASLARRTPAGTMVGLLTGLGLTAMEAYVLTSWQAQRRKHRRMNPANSHALRRSVRRIKAFHKLCGDADVIKPRKRCAIPNRFAKAC